MDAAPLRSSLKRDYTDILKILSALCVVFGHYCSYAITYHWSNFIIWKIVASQFGYIGVALFFFLSGYGLMESEKKEHLDIKHFVIRRFWKIYRPIIIVTLIWVLFELLFLQKSLSWGLFYTILWGFDDRVLWFVKILMGLYLLFYVFSYYHNKNRNLVGYAILTVGTVLLMIVAYHADGYSPIGIPCFMLGVIASVTKNLKIETVLLGSFFLISVVYSAITHDNQGYHAAIDYGIILVCLFIPIITKSCSSQSISPYCKSIAFASALTFDIYLVHYKILVGMTQIGGGAKR